MNKNKKKPLNKPQLKNLMNFILKNGIDNIKIKTIDYINFECKDHINVFLFAFLKINKNINNMDCNDLIVYDSIE